MKVSHKSVCSIVILFGFLIPAIFFAGDAHAQCRPLTSEACVDTVGNGRHWSFSQSIPYWTVVAVTPDVTDDKDIYLFTQCYAGDVLASSTQISGTDFIVGDFNHNTVGTYYPSTLFGTETDPYTVEWVTGGEIFPISTYFWVTTGGSPTPCNLVRIWDIFLEEGAEYKVEMFVADPPDVHLSLFRNPSTAEYWAGRGDSEWEIDENTPAFVYVPPATDWYGLVAFPNEAASNGAGTHITIEKLNDCIALDPGDRFYTPIYSPGGGPATDYAITPTSTSWVAMAMACQPTDTKGLYLYSECDKGGNDLAASAPGIYPGSTMIIVGDLNHAFPHTVYPVVFDGATDENYIFQWKDGPNYCPVGSPGVSGVINTTSTGCNLLDVYDISLVAGMEYRVRFQETGDANIHVALFRNLDGDVEYWGGRPYADWDIPNPTTGYVFTATASDVYGLVVLGNTINGAGTYSVEIERYNDCVPLPSEQCASSIGYPLDFSFYAEGYWAAVGVVPAEGDDKDINVFTECDGEGTLLATSGYVNGADFVVGDFNHMTAGTFNARITYGDPEAIFTIDSDRGNTPSEDMLPLNTLVEGELGNFGVDCRQLKIWDVFLEAGENYQIGFTRGGSADIWVALFYNPGNGDFWGGRSDSEWETPAHTTFTYSPPASDWYGLVAFANSREHWGNYSIRIDHVGTGTGVDPDPIAPEKFALYQNAPNPFNPSTIIRYDVPSGGGHVSLVVYDVNGRLIRSLRNEVEAPGEKSVTWDARDNNGVHVSSGVYFYRLVTPGYTATRKMVVTK